MAAARKRPRDLDETSKAECPFNVRIVDPKEREQKKKKRRRDAEEPEDGVPKIPVQLSPFAPTGKFKTHDNMDLHYQVEPTKRWQEMTRYNSFVCMCRVAPTVTKSSPYVRF